MRPEISEAAIADLNRIREFGDRKFGSLATDAYLEKLLDLLDLLGFAPRMARELPETRPGLRLHPYRAHAVFYRMEGNKVMIVRILHARQNWRDHL